MRAKQGCGGTSNALLGAASGGLGAIAVGAGVVGTATVTGAVVRRAQTAARGRTTVCGDGGGRPRNTKMYINPLTWK